MQVHTYVDFRNVKSWPLTCVTSYYKHRFDVNIMCFFPAVIVACPRAACILSLH